jgi:periplasmic divalent cation tolerance protein
VSAHCVVLSTVASGEEGERLARILVERRLAACVNLMPPMTSIYRWEGRVETAEERLLVIKTRAELFEKLRATLVDLHPYDVPEVIALDVTAGHPPYLSWLDESVSL